MISSGEKIDSAFLAQWNAPTIMAASINEQLLNFDKYMNNDQYPGLKASFSDFGGFLMTWNPTMYRVSSEIQDEVLDFSKKTSNQGYFYKEVIAGFSFNDENVKTELALINDVVSKKLGLGIKDGKGNYKINIKVEFECYKLL